MAAPDDDAPGPLMTTRTALILTISLLAGLGTGALLEYGGHHAAEAVIGGIGVFIAAALAVAAAVALLALALTRRLPAGTTSAPAAAER